VEKFVKNPTLIVIPQSFHHDIGSRDLVSYGATHLKEIEIGSKTGNFGM